MENTVDQGQELLDKIGMNHGVWGLDNGGCGGVKLYYDCVKTYY